MTKEEEKSNPSSCFNKANPGERMFVILERDEAFVNTVRFWVEERVRLGLNEHGDAKLTEALALTDIVEHAKKGVKPSEE